jgi:multiple sugar transport system permease protein
VSSVATESARGARRGRGQATPYLFMLPALLMVALVSIVPIIEAVALSLSRTSFLRVTGFVGTDNFGQLFRSEQFWGAVQRSAVYVFASLALVLPLGVLLAMLLNRRFRFRAFFRTIILLPWVVSQTIAALIWRWGLNADYGPFTSALGGITGGRIDPLVDPGWSMAVLIGVNVWLAYPFVVIMVLAALQGIPTEIVEAARVDGASEWKSFWSVTLPMITPTLLTVVIMLTLLFFNMVTLVFTLTAGGPFSATETLSLQAFRTSFQFFQLATGAALAVIIFVFNVVFSVLYVRVIRSDVYA